METATNIEEMGERLREMVGRGVVWAPLGRPVSRSTARRHSGGGATYVSKGAGIRVSTDVALDRRA